MKDKDAMRLFFFLIRLWIVRISILSVGGNNKYEEEHLSSLLKHFMLLEITTENDTHIIVSTTKQPIVLPSFEEAAETAVNVTTQFGKTITLHCKVNNLLDKMVSWVKKVGDKMHLLSYGQQVYSSDLRYQMIFKQPNDWQLKIQYANERDEGHYECQVSSHPPIAISVFLAVIVPHLEIADERGVQIKNKFYDVGSTIELKCLITKVPNDPNNSLFWKHGNRILNYDTNRGGISVKTEIFPDGAKSILYVADVKTTDSGNYTCSLSDIAETSVMVQVLNGETPAAMQHGDGCRCVHFHPLLIISSLIFICFLIMR